MSEVKHIRLFNRDGTSQQQRELAEINPLYAKIDDRQLKDLLSFLWRIAEYIQYYDLNNSRNGDWQNFIGVEQAVMLSLIAARDTAPMNYAYLAEQSQISETVDRNAYIPLFDLLYDHCLELKGLYDTTSRILGRELFLSQQNIRLLESLIKNLLALYMGYKGYSGGASDNYIKQFEAFIKEMDLDSTGITPVSDLTGLTVDLLDARMRNDLYGLHQDLQQLFMTVIGHAQRLLEETLNRQGSYEPHIGLILTFLRLFKSYQDQLNNLTAKHLEFYYQNVLKIAYREEIADNVYIIIQLARQTDLYKLEKGTEFKAGKDSEGKSLIYKATEEFIANKAQVAELKSLYHYAVYSEEEGKPLEIGQSGIPLKNIRAAEKADSLDGKEEPVDEENPQFPPFGKDEVIDYAELGFAFSSPILRMEGGTRTVTISIELKDKLSTQTALKSLLGDEKDSKFPDHLFDIYLTCDSKDGWEKLTNTEEEPGTIKIGPPEGTGIDGNDDKKKLDITFTLDSGFPAVIDFDSKIHTGQFDERWPVCKLVLKQNGERNYYELCRRLYLVSYGIKVEVAGLKNLVLQNDFGLQKAEKPIMIFGSQPMANAAFYIGSQEVFCKKLESVTIKWDWIDYMNPSELAGWYAGYENFSNDIEISFQRLVNGKWVALKGAGAENTLPFYNVAITNENTDSAAYELFPADKDEMFKEIDTFKKYTLDLKDGFIRISLEDNGFLFGHKGYTAAMMAPVQVTSSVDSQTGQVTYTTNTASVNPPITPMIQNVRLSYTSLVDHESDNLAFFHLHPFGISSEKIDPGKTEPTLDLVLDISEEGCFYIGLKGLKLPQSVSLLFQFVEGTGDFTVDMPDRVYWSYLTKDSWKPFDERGVLKDGTRNFSGTGIVLLSIPGDAATDSSLMPGEYHWLRAAVKERSRAVNMLASVQAQAMELVFFDQGNAADHYEAALPAGSISKLKEGVSQVKAVTQPFASFGARPKEHRNMYFVRVSERLRHKDRAVTLWDYEHLVLENFPQIHKVKCLNHMSADSEIAPGHVKVVVIPNLENLNAVNILQPAVSIILRNEIKEFLQGRCSTFVRVRVDNPRYEELKVIADVTFHKDCDVGYYNTQLSEDIKDFLTPWKSNSENIHFYERLHSSVILNFIEEREYVDYLSSFRVEKRVENEEPTSVVLGDIVRAHADSLFVSVEKHSINETGASA